MDKSDIELMFAFFCLLMGTLSMSVLIGIIRDIHIISKERKKKNGKRNDTTGSY